MVCAVNFVEKIVYDLVKKNPRLKIAIRNIYQKFFDILPDKKSFQLNDISVREGYFFGFHDCSPFSSDDDLVLANKLSIPLRMPLPQDGLVVGYFDSDYCEFKVIGESFAWNYHKGCRFQWLDSINKKAIYNTCIDNKLKAVVYDVVSGHDAIIDSPIDSTSLDGRYASSFSYFRLNSLMPGYGYDIEDNAFLEESAPISTGLFVIDISSGLKSLLISLDKLSKLSPDESMIGARHYVTHSLFSPDANYVAFLHRWIHGDVMKRFSRLVICSLDGEEVYISPTSGMVSHYVWNERNGLLVYCQIDGVDGHYLFVDHRLQDPKRIAQNILNSDGHQHFVPNTNKFVTDTYPDRRRFAKLYLVDIESDQVNLLCDLKSPKEYQTPDPSKHWACDFHPRVNHTGDIVCFDSVHSGERSMCFMKINR